MKTLVDSNVIIAYLDRDHQHHTKSRRVFQSLSDDEILLSVHSLSECFNKLTRGVVTQPFGPREVTLSLRTLVSKSQVRALSVEETCTAMDKFASMNGRGARLYDYLIGYVAIVETAPKIVTWNVRDMAPLFPTLTVVTPADFTGAT